MSKECKTTLDAANKHEATRRFIFDRKLDAAIGDMIGFPSDKDVRKAEDSYRYEQLKPAHKRTKSIKALKKKWISEQKKYDEHTKLYDSLRNFTLESAESMDFDERIVDIHAIMDDWQSIFSDRGRGLITPVTIQQGKRKIKALNGLVERVMKKRRHLKKIQKIPKYLLFSATPNIVASWADDFGILNKIIKKVKILSDAGVSDSHEFSIPMSKVSEKLGKIIYNLAATNVSEFSTEKIFNINN